MNTMPITSSRVARDFADLWIAIGLSLGAAVSLGFSRFAYALLLPAMRASLHWNYVQAGGMNTSNAVGYVFGSAVAAWVSRRMGIKRAFLATLAVSGVVLVSTGLTSDYIALMTLRFVGGFATAITFIVGASLAAGVNPAGTPQRAALALAIYITGVGSGIAVSGLVVPPVLAHLGAAGWPAGWTWMGAISIAALVPAAAATRRVPPHAARDEGVMPWKDVVFLWPTFVNYLLFAAGYVSYMTFIILLIRNGGGGADEAAAFWVVLGLSSVLGTLAWGRVLPKLGIRMSSPVVAIVVLLGTLPVLVSQTVAAAFISAIVFGASFMAGPTAVTVIVRKLLRPQTWTAALAALTVAFAIGQAIGPLASGVVSDATGSVGAGLWIAPVLLVAAAVVALFQRTR
jgi:predicted MFS family arabinose efflux permease